MYARGSYGNSPWERSSQAYGQHYRPASTNSGHHQQFGLPMRGLSATMPSSHNRVPATPSIFSRSNEMTQGDALMRAKMMRQVNPGRAAPMTAPSLHPQSGLNGGSFGGGGLGMDAGSRMGGGRHAASYMGRGAHAAPSLADRGGLQSGGLGRSSMMMPPPSGGRSGHSLLPSHAPAPAPPATASLRPPSSYPGPPPTTPGPPTAMTSASRTIMGTYPGKAANQDAYVMQSIAPLDERPGTGQSGAPATVGRDDLRAEAGGDAIIGVYDGHGEHGHHVSRFVKEKLVSITLDFDNGHIGICILVILTGMSVDVFRLLQFQQQGLLYCFGWGKRRSSVGEDVQGIVFAASFRTRGQVVSRQWGRWF